MICGCGAEAREKNALILFAYLWNTLFEYCNICFIYLERGILELERDKLELELERDRLELKK